MKRKNRLMIIAMVAIIAIGFGTLSLTGCGGGPGGGSPTDLPANLQNTKWASDPGGNPNYVIEFGKNTIDKAGNWGGPVRTVFSATNNGKITAKMGSESVWQYMDEEVICTSYSISDNKITFVGSDEDWELLVSKGPYTKVE